MSALAGIIPGAIWDFLKNRLWAKWLALLFTLWISSTVTFLFATAAVLGAGAISAVKGAPVDVPLLVCGALAAGMGSTASVLIYLVARSPLTKGMLFAFPTEAIEKEIASQITAVSGTGKLSYPVIIAGTPSQNSATTAGQTQVIIGGTPARPAAPDAQQPASQDSPETAGA